VRWTIPLLLLAACHEAPSAGALSTGTPGTATTPPTPPSSRPNPADPIRCEHDTDCPGLACGPCTSGATVTQSYLGLSCFHDPCCNHPPCVSAVCKNHICVVK
jgi:hypothetical protein